jgi:cytochrome c5
MRWLFLFAGFLSLTSAVWAEDLTPAEQTRARKLYVSKCAKCHKFYEPRGYTDAEWERWMIAMGKKSRLKQADETLLNRYLDGYRAGELPPPAKR